MEGSSRNLEHARSEPGRVVRKHRGPQKDPTKIIITLHRDIVETLRGTGKGWHSRINAALRKLVDPES
jgi:uncharacterized protein (DUF4415 family)